VHIGRIEVTAAPATPAPTARPQRPLRATLTLADYLAKRTRS
jgi:hypothetical protein